MINPEFNLLDEPWIRVMEFSKCSIKEVSLRDAFVNAHKYSGLSGELKAQDFAVLRLMLSVLHAVWLRVDADGVDCPIESTDEAVDRWESLWNRGAFPTEPILSYLEKNRDGFWLFHPERPFWQVPAADIGSPYTSAKMNGELSESGNKRRLFSTCAGVNKEQLTYSEAARWLLYVNAFDDTSAKPKAKGKPSVGAGWLGKLGMIAVKGQNLFETLMLNLTLLRDGEEVWELDDSGKLPWERETPVSDERREIAKPSDPSQILTLQSRRIMLKRKGGSVIGYTLLGGDFFDKINTFSEQMTVWSSKKENSKSPTVYQPRRHDASKQMWREFGAMFVKGNGEEKHLPGVVSWINLLRNQEVLPKTYEQLTFSIASVQYGDKDFFITDVFSDSLSFRTALLSNFAFAWQTNIIDEIAKCDELAKEIGKLAAEICIAAGGDPEFFLTYGSDAKAQIYHRLDSPFRSWLRSIDPESDGDARAAKLQEWEDKARSLALQFGEEIVMEAGPKAFAGREVMQKDKGKKEPSPVYHSSAKAEQWFRRGVYGIYKRQTVSKE